jgi:hypothetical protein
MTKQIKAEMTHSKTPNGPHNLLGWILVAFAFGTTVVCRKPYMTGRSHGDAVSSFFNYEIGIRCDLWVWVRGLGYYVEKCDYHKP